MPRWGRRINHRVTEAQSEAELAATLLRSEATEGKVGRGGRLMRFYRLGPDIKTAFSRISECGQTVFSRVFPPEPL